MYYLSVVEIFMKEVTIDGVFFAGVKDLEKFHLNEIVRRFLTANGSLNNFKKYVSDEMRDHLFDLAIGHPYKASIYQFDTLDEINKILSDYEKSPDRHSKDMKISAPKVASVQSVIPEDIYYFKIDWE